MRIDEGRRNNWAWRLVAALAVCGGVAFVILRTPGDSNSREEDARNLRHALEAKSKESVASLETMVNAVSPALREQTWDDAVDLMKAIKVYKGTIAGSWRVEDGKLNVERTDAATLELPYVPPQEYDFLIVFSVAREGGSVGQILYANAHQFGWYMGAYTNRYFGFQMIAGKAMPENPTGVLVDQCLQANRSYTSLVEVRKGGVTAYLNGALISQRKADFGDVSLFEASRLRGADLLGLWSADTAATFFSIRVREVTGKGKLEHDEGVPGEF